MKKKYLISICIILVMIGTVIFMNNKEKDSFVKDTCYLLNTVVEQKWYGKNREKTIEEVYNALSHFENKFSSYVENSEISVINSMAGIEPVIMLTKLSFDTMIPWSFARLSTTAIRHCDTILESSMISSAIRAPISVLVLFRIMVFIVSDKFVLLNAPNPLLMFYWQLM